MMRSALFLCAFVCLLGHAGATTYFVDARSPTASDTGPGTEDLPWKTISRAAAAEEVKPGDTVLIKSGVYRESVAIEVSGEKENPITFAAAPGAHVVIKGSEVIKGKWERQMDAPDAKEPFPGAFTGLCKTQLGDEFFTDPDFPEAYRDQSRRWVSQVFVDDEKPLQRIGPDPIYRNEEHTKITVVGRSLEDIHLDSFYFDPADQTLSVKMIGEPAWFNIEVGVRGWALRANRIHDVVVKGLEMRHNRQPGGQWPMVSCAECERVVFEDCRIYQADFCGIAVGRSKNCVVRNCDVSYNGSTGIGLGWSEDCLIEDCKVMFNNYRRFSPGWHAGGMKCIPNNRRCTVRRCEAAYNIASHGIWFDSGNSDVRILDNTVHHNHGYGIFFEINMGGGIIANNLVYANRCRGIYISGSQKTWVVHNTVAHNNSGIVCMPRGEDYPLADVHVLNNLFINNYVTGETANRGCDLTLFMDAEGEEWNPGERRLMSVHSDYNVYADTSWTPFMRHAWNVDNTIEQWRKRFGEDLHSRLVPVKFDLRGTEFELLTTEGLDVAGPLPEDLAWTPKKPSRVGCSW